ncbi:hypothetical protein B1A_14362, partial [mine drainage metagenome]
MTKHTYKATVTREDRWWMVRIPEIGGLTQARRLSEAKSMARSLVAITLDIPADCFDIDVEVEKVGTVKVAERTAQLRAARETATRLEREVQIDSENLARDLAS